MSTPEKRLCIYLRVSLSRQQGTESLAAQEKACAKVAKSLGLKVDPRKIFKEVD